MHRVLAIPHENLSVLNGALQLHGALRKRDQGTTPIQRYVHHGQIGQPLERSPVVLPPLVSATTAISIQAGLFGATARLANAFFIALAHLDPELDDTRQILLPEIRLIFGA